MAYARTMCKASKIEKLKNNLVTEKQNSIEISHGIKPKLGLKQKYQHFWIDLGLKTKRCCKRICVFPERTCIYRTCFKLKHEGTCENFVLKSMLGFIGGFFLTYIFFMFFVFQLNFKLSTATIMCSIFGSILTIGLAFSYKIRCIVFLLLPQFFSKRGRQALLAYAFILAITGPAKNTLHNMGILSESLACGQEQLKAAVRQIIEVIKKPFYAIKDAIKAVVKTVKEIIKKIKEILLKIKRVVMAILKVIKAAFQFLGKIINICNKELGTPFQRCTRVFENAITDCNAKLGPLFNWLCSITYLVQSVCYLVKIFDFICMIVDFINDSIIGVVVRKIKTFVRHIRTMFYVRIKFSHSFHFETNQSKSISEVASGIVTEIKERTEGMMVVFDFMSCATSLFFLFIIIRVMYYRYKFLTSERFDNKFITKDFRAIDLRRAQLEKETVLPLNHRERGLYVSVGSIRLVQCERTKLAKSAVVLCIATLKLCTHMMADYALFWVLTLIRYHARFQSTVQTPNIPTLHIEGKGILADLLRSIVKAFQPLGIKLEIDTIPCLPDPIPPDYDRYVQIASLLVLCWILAIFEPYGLRLRHSVMCYYHPARAKQRSIWLYNHIMRARSSFLKFARRQLRRKVAGSKDITKVTCKEYLRARIDSKVLRLCLGEDRQDACLLCAEVFREKDKIKPIRCKTPGCPGIYCEQCFSDLQNLCTVCLDPIEYGDLSDISEEKDSSEEEYQPKKSKKSKKKKKAAKKVVIMPKDPKDDDDDESKKQLLPKETQLETDSDGKSSGNLTDYSYSYQDDKDITTLPVFPTTSPFTDIEEQHIPDYASMESFREDSEEEDIKNVTTDFLTTSTSSILTELEAGRKFSSKKLSETNLNNNSSTYFIAKSSKIFDYVRRKSRYEIEEEIPLLTDQDETNESDFNKSQLTESETTFIQTPRSINLSSSGSSIQTFPPAVVKPSALSSTSSIDSEFRSKIGITEPAIPRLDLSFLNANDRQRINERFKNVKYEVVNESSTSLTSKSSTPKTCKSIDYLISVPMYDYQKSPTTSKITQKESHFSNRSRDSDTDKSRLDYKKRNKRESGDNLASIKRRSKLARVIHKMLRKKESHFYK